MKDIAEIPADFEGWTLIGPAEHAVHNSSIAVTIRLAPKGWEYGRAEAGLLHYLITDLPHPDAPTLNAIYMLDLSKSLQRLCDELDFEP
tara:strand:+ start:153 stop:419 length:267 start_codon:yes stop_codon:yes gene_type:complete